MIIVIWSFFLSCAGALLLALSLPMPIPDPASACRVYDRRGRPVGLLQREHREPIPLGQVPPFLLKAVLAVEDQDFYHHQGFSPRGVLRAFWHDLKSGRFDQGGSTITQQLAKNLFLNGDRTIGRKIKEAFYSLRLELHYNKDRILQAYLNQIYFGHGAFGVHAAARTYFGRELSSLNRRELALLAGLPRGPALYSPYLHPTEARNRIETVLERMLETKAISPAEAKNIRREPLRLPGAKNRTPFAPYFMDYIRREAARILREPPESLDWKSLRIETTLDVQWQKAAEIALKSRLPSGRPDSEGIPQPQGALIALDPEDGAIRAMVGGADYRQSSFNRAVDARRQPGSAFKPFLYLAALEKGFTLASKLPCQPLEIRMGNQIYRPVDHGSIPYHNRDLRLREALALSCNVAAVRLNERLGRQTLVRMARRLGIRSPLSPLPSLPLGTSEVTPLELAGAYCALANGGNAVSPYAIRRILNRDGRTLWQAPRKVKPCVDPRLSYLLTSALRDVTGPGGTAPVIGWQLDFPVAGKTGTSECNRDAWFAGYTPYVAAVVYVGDDQNRPLPGGGGQIAAPIWADFARIVHHSLPARDFPIPSGISSLEICRETGMRATPFCPRVNEYFTDSTAPAVYCVKHRRFTLRVCKRSGLLPNPYCRTEKREYNWGEQPTEICRLCRKPRSFWEWLFNRPFPRFQRSLEDHRLFKPEYYRNQKINIPGVSGR